MRRIDFEGSFNFRDLGGWRTNDGRSVRWNKLYRADSVHLLTEADVERAHAELGIRTLIDLRSDAEVQFGGLGALAGLVVARYHAPIGGHPRSQPIDAAVPVGAASSDRSPDAMVERYLAILENSSDLVVEAVRHLAREDALPAVFFCAAGKDRTGVLAAVVLGALGVRGEDIVADYVLTEESIEAIITRFARNDGAPAMYRELPPSHFAPVAETMERVLDGVRSRYGSFADYLTSHGLGSDELRSLRASLIE
jgi:protein tyrosine/serine phosphatase